MNHTVQRAFNNPILDTGADPWMVYHNGDYYFTCTTGKDISVWKTNDVLALPNAKKVTVWEPSPDAEGNTGIWAPELHFIDGHWFIYYAAEHDGDNTTHRMYVLESMGADPQGAYVERGKIADSTDMWAIDGTVLQHKGELYFIWSGWEKHSNVDIFPQNLYIAPMSDPCTISGERVLLSTPTFDWEMSVAAINEGPQILTHEGTVHLVFSANASWTDEYCLGILTLQQGSPLNPKNWVKHSEPVFQKSVEHGVYGPGHCSFVASRNGNEHFIVYHAARHQGSGWDRNVRVQPFSWDKSGTPVFGVPVMKGIVAGA